MFDEKSCKWIKVYKCLTVIAFFVFIVFGIVAGIGDAMNSFLDLDLGGCTIVFDFLVWAIAGIIVGFIQLTFNMLVIQLLNNVQIIREKAENS